MELFSYSDKHSQADGEQFVSLMACFEELVIECLSTRSAFISAQRDVMTDSVSDGNGVVKVPAAAAKAWIRTMFCTPAQLQALDDATLIHYVKVCHLVSDVVQYASVCLYCCCVATPASCSRALSLRSSCVSRTQQLDPVYGVRSGSYWRLALCDKPNQPSSCQHTMLGETQQAHVAGISFLPGYLLGEVCVRCSWWPPLQGRGCRHERKCAAIKQQKAAIKPGTE